MMERRKMNTDNTIFDDVFRTLVEKLPQLVIPLVNEAFHTTYDKNTEIVQLRDEHQGKDGERITDSSLRIGKKIYHIECQSISDSTMEIRMIEYDFFIALEYVKKEKGIYKMEFPRSCVLYLRHNKNTKDRLKVKVVFPDGKHITYKVPVIKVQDYTKDVIFRKNLLFLLPFYIMRYEKDAAQIEQDDEKLAGLLAEYEEIQKRLRKALGDGEHGREYTELVELITRISDYIFREKEKARKGVSDKMRGKVLELEVEIAEKKAYAEGVSHGISEGRAQGISAGLLQGRVQAYADAGFSLEQIAEKVNIPMEEVLKILQDLKFLSSMEREKKSI